MRLNKILGSSLICMMVSCFAESNGSAVEGTDYPLGRLFPTIAIKSLGSVPEWCTKKYYGSEAPVSIRSEEKTFNEQGQLLRSERTTFNSTDFYDQYEYDYEGRLIVEQLDFPVDDASVGFAVGKYYKYKYDDEDRVIWKETLHRLGFSLFVETYNYGKHGIFKYEKIDEHDGLEVRETWTYLADGHLDEYKTETFDLDGAITNVTRHSYESGGVIIIDRYAHPISAGYYRVGEVRDVEGRVITTWSQDPTVPTRSNVKTYEFDTEGHQIRRTHDSEDDGIIDSWRDQSYVYDDQNRIVESVTIGSDGLVLQETWGFDEYGLLIWHERSSPDTGNDDYAFIFRESTTSSTFDSIRADFINNS